jgi:serine/threonine protein kinase
MIIILNVGPIIHQVRNHKFVVEFLGFVPDQLAVIMSFMPNGSLQKLLYDNTNGDSDSKPPLTLASASALSQLPAVYGSPAKETVLVRMALESALGLKHLHSEGVIFRDLSARNVLVDADLHVRVADYGFARLQEVRSQKGVYTTSTVGPIKWSAPEAIRRQR